MNKKIIGSIVVALLLIVGACVVVSRIVLAAEVSVDTSKTQFPIAELGGCKDAATCAVFCSKTEHMLACVNYAEVKGMLSAEELAMSKKVATRVSNGTTPGGCKDEVSCRTFCETNTASIKECVAFAEELGVIPADQLERAKKVMNALDKGASLPGGCAGEKQCNAYCSEGAHIDECLAFAEAADIIPADELAQAKKIAPFLKSGETPGKCTTKQSCETYCADDNNIGECLGFAEKAGLISAEEAAMAKKVGGKGPGGCKSKDTCEAYCADDAHTDECFNFAVEKGLVSEEQLQQMNQGISQIKSGLEQVPPEARTLVETCLRDVIGAEKFDAVMAGTQKPSSDFGVKVPQCFESAMKVYAQQMMNSARENIPASQNGGGMGISGQGDPVSIPPEMQAQVDAVKPPSQEEIQKMMQNVPEQYRNMIPNGIPPTGR